MKDYKELIKELKSWLDDTRGHEIPMVFYVAVCKAVQAIEQLVKERDAAIAEMRKEADNCRWCKWWKHPKNFVQRCTCEEPCCVDGNPDRWEWRGVQNERT